MTVCTSNKTLFRSNSAEDQQKQNVQGGSVANTTKALSGLVSLEGINDSRITLLERRNFKKVMRLEMGNGGIRRDSAQLSPVSQRIEACHVPRTIAEE
eukprot:Nk52_evm4s366 gene=Nk52_evmTU4s366